MNQTLKETRSGKNYTAAQTGEFERLGQFTLPHPALPREVEGKLFLKEALGLTGMEVSLNKLPARTFVPFAHKHRQNEELYVFVRGRGEFMVDGEIIPVREGTVIRVAPEGARAWRNSSDEDLYYLVIQARAGTMPVGSIHDGETLEGRPRWRKKQSSERPPS